MRQASRRSWRIGQTQPVRVVFMVYRNSLQADALKLVAKKLQSSLAVEAAFVAAPDAETDAEEYLVDDGWGAPETGPETVAVDDVSTGIEPMLDNGRHDESPEQRRRCFPGRSSWPRGRSSPEAAAASLSPRASRYSSGRLAWSGREVEPVGTER